MPDEGEQFYQLCAGRAREENQILRFQPEQVLQGLGRPHGAAQPRPAAGLHQNFGESLCEIPERFGPAGFDERLDHPAESGEGVFHLLLDVH